MASPPKSLLGYFHRVAQVVPEEQEPIVLEPTTSVREALEIMQRENISQAPIVRNNYVLDVFSYRSLSLGLLKLPKGEDVLSLSVDQFMEELHFATASSELSRLFDEFDISDAVLVGSEEKLQGVLTTIDALKYFYGVASPYVLLQEIELAIRELIRKAIVEEAQLAECIASAVGDHYLKQEREVPKSLQELTINDCVMVVRHKTSWSLLQEAFGGTRSIVGSKLAPLAELRNRVFHFRDDLTTEEYDTLRDTRNWLLGRIQQVAVTQ